MGTPSSARPTVDGTVRNSTMRSPRRSVPRSASPVAPRGVARQVGQRGRADGDAEDADGQLHQPERVAEPGDRAVGDQAGERRVDHDVDLHGRHAQRRGRHQRGDPARARVAQRADRAAAAGGSPASTAAGSGSPSWARPPTSVSAAQAMTADARRRADEVHGRAADDRDEVEHRRGQRRARCSAPRR